MSSFKKQSELDRVSDLPLDLIACILGKMPIREAVRTSVLTKKWRFYYYYIPQLVFDDHFSDEEEKKGSFYF